MFHVDRVKFWRLFAVVFNGMLKACQKSVPSINCVVIVGMMSVVTFFVVPVRSVRDVDDSMGAVYCTVRGAY